VKETNEIYTQMKEELERKTGVVLADGGDMALRLNAVASELSTLWAQVDWTKDQSFPQTASGEYLNLHAYARGLERTSGASATGSIRFETDAVRSEDISVALGTVCLNAAGAEFVTTESALIRAGELFCIAPAAARAAGKAGNIPANSVIFMALAPVGVLRCYNPEAFSGGTDIESDDALRVRILGSYASLPNGSNKAFYESEARNTDGVAAVRVLPRERGLGTVDIIISSSAGVPSQTLLDTVKSKFEAQREICVDVEVSAPSSVTVPVSVAVSVEDGYTFSSVSAAVRTALSGYFSGELLGKDVLRARLGYVIFGVEGVKNYSILLPAADIPITDSQLPVAGTITVTEG